MNKRYGDGAVLLANYVPSDIDVIEHPSIGFNLASSTWGVPRGGIVVIEGDQHTGKSTFVLETIASAQKQGLTCMLMDYEYSLDRTYAERLGVDFDNLILSTPTSMEDGYNIAVDALENGIVDLLVIDSISAMEPEMVQDKEIGQKSVAPEAKIHSDALRRLKPLLKKQNACLIGISQYRAQVGSMSPNADKGLSGGNAWKFYPDFRIKLSRLITKKDDGYFVNNVEITKNKKGTAFLKHKMFYTINSGVDKVRELIEYGKEVGVIKQAGAWYSHKDTKLGGGMEAVRTFFEDNPEYFQNVKEEVITALRG